MLTDEQVREGRDRIRAVAERQVATNGIAKTSLRTIARELGWTAATLYRYFHNKEELLAATRAAALDRFSECIEAAYASSDDLWERSRAIGQAYADFAFAEPAAYQLIFAFEQPTDNTFPDLARADARSRRTLLAYVEDMVTAGILEGDPEVISRIYWASLHGLIVLQMAGKLNAAPPFDLLRREAARLITRGARPTGAPGQDDDGPPPGEAAG